MPDAQSFDLWLEWEEGDSSQPANRPTENFGNISVTLPTGARYALNIWTFDFVPLARKPWPYESEGDPILEKYLLPPDLLVERLDRSLLEGVIADLLQKGSMKSEWLCVDDELP